MSGVEKDGIMARQQDILLLLFWITKEPSFSKSIYMNCSIL